MKHNTVYSVSALLTVPEQRKDLLEKMELHKETLLVRGGTRKGQKLARAECVPLWVTKNQECFCSFLTFSSEKQPQQSRMGAVDRTWGAGGDWGKSSSRVHLLGRANF